MRRVNVGAPAGRVLLGGSRRVSLHCVWLQSELRPALYVEAALRARRRRRRPAPLSAPRTPSHLALLAIPGVICSTVYAKFYTFLNIHKLSTLMIQGFIIPKLVFCVTHACYVYYTHIMFQQARRRCTSIRTLLTSEEFEARETREDCSRGRRVERESVSVVRFSWLTSGQIVIWISFGPLQPAVVDICFAFFAQISKISCSPRST